MEYSSLLIRSAWLRHRRRLLALEDVRRDILAEMEDRRKYYTLTDSHFEGEENLDRRAASYNAIAERLGRFPIWEFVPKAGL